MKFTLGFSFCPNDTFIFYAMTHGTLKTSLNFAVHMADVEELNRMALKGKLDITKISVAVLPRLKDYVLLDAGAAFGLEEAPIVVSKTKNLNELTSLAIPGKNTTAYLLFSKFFPEIKEKVHIKDMRYDLIMEAVFNEEVDAGILIHEGRFTYKNKGLKLIADLGHIWKTRYNDLPIPLGCIVIKKELGKYKSEIERLIRESIEFAYRHEEEVMPFVKQHAQELSDETIEKHIKAFVNEYSFELGEQGKKAIEILTGELP